MGKITIEEFMKLSAVEKRKRHKDLSDSDKFLARMTDQAIGARVIPDEELTEEQREKVKKMKNDTKTLEEMEKEMDKRITKLKEMRALKKK